RRGDQGRRRGRGVEGHGRQAGSRQRDAGGRVDAGSIGTVRALAPAIESAQQPFETTTMFFQFFDELRAARIPVTLKEYLALMDALSRDVIDMKVDEFYYLSRTALVKDERNLDKFDRVFGHVFRGLEGLDASLIAQIPEEWLRALTEKYLTEEEKK